MSGDLLDRCDVMRQDDTAFGLLVCGLPTDHEGPHAWIAAVVPATTSRAQLDPKSMRDVLDALYEVNGDEDDVAIALAHGKVAGGKYPGLTAARICVTAQGRYDVWAMARAMSDGIFA